MTDETSDKIGAFANNVLLVLLSRLAMVLSPLVLSALVALSSSYLNGRFAEVGYKIDAITKDLGTVQVEADNASRDVASLEQQTGLTAQSVASNAAAVNTWQVGVNGRLDKLTDSINALGNQVSGLAATIRAQRPTP